MLGIEKDCKRKMEQTVIFPFIDLERNKTKEVLNVIIFLLDAGLAVLFRGYFLLNFLLFVFIFMQLTFIAVV